LFTIDDPRSEEQADGEKNAAYKNAFTDPDVIEKAPWCEAEEHAEVRRERHPAKQRVVKAQLHLRFLKVPKGLLRYLEVNVLT
jgi:hypothetical protein